MKSNIAHGIELHLFIFITLILISYIDEEKNPVNQYRHRHSKKLFFFQSSTEPGILFMKVVSANIIFDQYKNIFTKLQKKMQKAKQSIK